MVNYSSKEVDYRQYPFVPKEEESDYLGRHRISIKDLSNGIRIISMSRLVEDSRVSNLMVEFATGAYHDPEGKTGIHHLLEHLAFDRDSIKKAATLDVTLNGATSSSQYYFTMYGTLHPDVIDYGIWPMIPDLRRMLENPLDHHPDSELAIETERAIVLREVAERNAANGAAALKFRQGILYAPNNPMVFPAVGIPEQLMAIKRDELEELGKRVLIPQGTMVFALTEGEDSVNEMLTKRLAEEFSDFPGIEQTSHPVDLSLLNKLNSNFEPGQTYVCEEKYQKGLNSIELLWLFTNQPYSVEILALDRLSVLLSRTASDFVRDNGLSYGGNFATEAIGTNSFCRLNFTIGEKTDLSSFIKQQFIGRLKKAFAGITEDHLATINTGEQLRQKAIDIARRDRFNMLTDGLREYGRVVDADQVKDRYRMVTLKDLKMWREAILDQDPTTFIY